MWPLSWLSSAHWRIWPRPKEDADSTALLGAGVTGSQAQWAGLTCESCDLNAWGLGWLQKGPLLLTQSALSLLSVSLTLPSQFPGEWRAQRGCVTSALGTSLLRGVKQARRSFFSYPHMSLDPAHIPSIRFTWKKTSKQN